MRKDWLPQAEWDAKHDAFIKSPRWKVMRMEAIVRAGRKCERCGCSPGRFEVHHRNYNKRRFGGGELPSDLEALCGPCHKRHHGRPIPNPNKPIKIRRKTFTRRQRRNHERKACAHCGGTYSKARHRAICLKYNLAKRHG